MAASGQHGPERKGGAILQEDIERRFLALSVSAGRMTSRVLARVLSSALRQIRRANQKAHTPHGRQSVKKLMNHAETTNSIPLDGNTRLFDRTARKYNVDYAFYKTGPKKYLLFFKAKQADAITACFSEYTKRALHKGRKPPIREQVRQAADLARNKQSKERTREREAARDDR